MAEALFAVRLAPVEIGVLRSCRKDGAPPTEIKDPSVHRRLEAWGLMDRRVGPAPDGEGFADFWSTNANGEWALSVIDRRAASLDLDLYECAACSAKPGAPTLCEDCVARRDRAGKWWKGPRP